MRSTPAQRRALHKLCQGPGFVPVQWIGTRVVKALVARGLALTTTTREVAPTPYGRWVGRETKELFDA